LDEGEAPASAGLASSQFRSLRFTDSELRRFRDWEVVIDLLIEAGSSRLTAERIVEIERGEAEPGRARHHARRSTRRFTHGLARPSSLDALSCELLLGLRYQRCSACRLHSTG
jgi:hypothetical protein